MTDGLGMGFLLHYIFGDNSATVEAIESCKGKALSALCIDPDRKEDGALVLSFGDCDLVIWDDARSCCENRWMHTDDALEDFVGAEFRGVSLRDGAITEREYDVLESQFLIIHTSLGDFTIVNYNEHNGYYGGICPRAEVDRKEHCDS